MVVMFFILLLLITSGISLDLYSIVTVGSTIGNCTISNGTIELWGTKPDYITHYVVSASEFNFHAIYENNGELLMKRLLEIDNKLSLFMIS